MVEIPHFAFPFARASAVEQDTPEHIMACENVIVRCPVGFRDERPEFGWAWPEFHTTPLDLGPLQDALARFEPRGDANAYEYADAADAATRNITIEVES